MAANRPLLSCTYLFKWPCQLCYIPFSDRKSLLCKTCCAGNIDRRDLVKGNVPPTLCIAELKLDWNFPESEALERRISALAHFRIKCTDCGRKYCYFSDPDYRDVLVFAFAPLSGNSFVIQEDSVYSKSVYS